ncbi:MAG: adenylosuccinate lyase [Halobacteriaceae archaeon]
MVDEQALYTISPLDGRYATMVEPLTEYVSEAALMRARTRVEAEYLIALSDHDDIPISITEQTRIQLRKIYQEFDTDDAKRIKKIETEGTETYPATNHDVKAIEYFLRSQLPNHLNPWIHFGLTSEDVTNIAYRILIRDALTDILIPSITQITDQLIDFAHVYADTPMVAKTHGQPASPTTFGKEMAVFASRLIKNLQDLQQAVEGMEAKFSGATGTYAAHTIAIQGVNWRAFAADFVTRFDMSLVEPTTQINPGDDINRIFNALQYIHAVLLDLDRDMWEYIQNNYLHQTSKPSETGSSTMPHKINPIDFENSEGNLAKANTDLDFIGDYITTSRLQRDLSDSTVKRNMGAALGHSLIGYEKLSAGLSKIEPNEEKMLNDLHETPEVITEAIQTILRREGETNAYEIIKDQTRGESITLEELHSIIDTMDIQEDTKEELRALTPAKYTGLAAELAESIERQNNT